MDVSDNNMTYLNTFEVKHIPKGQRFLRAIEVAQQNFQD